MGFRGRFALKPQLIGVATHTACLAVVACLAALFAVDTCQVAFAIVTYRVAFAVATCLVVSFVATVGTYQAVVASSRVIQVHYSSVEAVYFLRGLLKQVLP